MTHRLFVYGTLRRGERNHGILAGARFLGAARTRAEWRRIRLGPYPSLAPGSEPIEGELYEIDTVLLEALDRFEGVPERYQRVTLALEDGSLAEAYVRPDL